MATLRQQFSRKVVVNLAASPSTTEIDIVGPESATAVPYAENSDHVIEPRQVRQNEAGWCVVDGFAASGLDVDDVTYDIEIWRRPAQAAQKGLEGPLFPSGAAAAAVPSLSRVVASGLLGAADEALIVSSLGGSLGGVDAKDVPALHLRADEFVRIRATKTAGAALGPISLYAKFDLGGHPGDTHRLA